MVTSDGILTGTATAQPMSTTPFSLSPPPHSPHGSLCQYISCLFLSWLRTCRAASQNYMQAQSAFQVSLPAESPLAALGSRVHSHSRWSMASDRNVVSGFVY